MGMVNFHSAMICTHYTTYTLVADGENTAAPECDLPVGMLSECQHLCILSALSVGTQRRLVTVLRLGYLYSLPLLFRQPYQGNRIAGNCRQLQLEGSCRE